PFVRGWVHVALVYSRWRSASLWLRNRPPAALAGPHRFVRRRDGLVVELGSDPHRFLWDVFEGVFRDLGEAGTAGRIGAEVVSRTAAYWAEREVEWEADRALDAIMTVVARALAAQAEELPQEPGWSKVAYGVRETAWRESDDPDAAPLSRGLFGSVEGEH